MAVEKMKLISLFGEYDRLNECISGLMNTGCFHPEDAKTATAGSKGFSAINEVNPLSLRLKKLTEVLDFCGIDVTEIDLSAKTDIEENEIDEVLSKLSDELHALQTQREKIITEIDEKKAILTSLEHFGKLDADLSTVENSDFIKVKFGKLPYESYEKLVNFIDNPYIVFQACSKDDKSYWGVYLTPADKEEEVDRIFASLFFEQISLPDGLKNPKKAVDEYEACIDKLNEELKKTEDSIQWYYNNQGKEMISLYSQVKSNYNVFEYRRLAVKYNGKFATMIGWVPVTEIEKIVSNTSKLGDYSVTEVTSGSTHLGIADLTPPTKMKNKKIFRPFEFYVDIYGVPGYNEVDPTAFVAITYTVLYGIMFADLGQGIALALVGLFMWYKMKMPLGKILVPCGLAGAVFGLVFGSVFGNEKLLNPLYRLLGFEEKPIEVMTSATALLAVSVGIGFFLILVAMIFGVVSNIKKKKLGMALFGPNGIAGIILYFSIVAVALGLVLKLDLPITLMVICGIIIPVILIFLHVPLCSLIEGKGFKVESIGDFILESVFELLETVLSYFTNTVSFLRVGAFVLIHAGMMMAFTSLSAIVGGGVAGVIMMIFGNIFVIALEGLLVGIQVLRLEFYEMFSRYYDGDGHPFKPLTAAHIKK